MLCSLTILDDPNGSSGMPGRYQSWFAESQPVDFQRKSKAQGYL